MKSKFNSSFIIRLLKAVHPFLLTLTLLYGSTGTIADDIKKPAVFKIWTPDAFSNELTVNKAAPIFGPIGLELKQEVSFHSTSEVSELTNQIKRDNVDLILWGYSPEVDRIFQNFGFIEISHGFSEIFLFKKKHSSQKAEVAAIGAIASSPALYVTKDFYLSADVSISEHANFYSLIKALGEGKIDYIAAPHSFYNSLAPAIKTRYEKAMSFPNTGKVSVYSKKSIQGTNKEKIITNYFYENSTLIGDLVGTGQFVTSKFNN